MFLLNMICFYLLNNKITKNSIYKVYELQTYDIIFLSSMYGLSIDLRYVPSLNIRSVYFDPIFVDSIEAIN